MRIVQVGVGPLGQKTVRFLVERGAKIVAAVDKNPEFKGLDLGTVCGLEPLGVKIKTDFAKAVSKKKADVAVLTTVSGLKDITPQIEEIVACGVNVVSTCEELSYPWIGKNKYGKRIDKAARKNGVAVLGTGINPGFLMDSFAATATAVCQKVESIKVERVQDAQYRRIPFQKKIGAGLTLEQFEEKRKTGTLRHVGLAESVSMIAARMGWKLDEVKDELSPIVATRKIVTKAMTIKKGDACGVQQIGRGSFEGRELITLVFRAAVGMKKPHDSITVKGDPSFTSCIDGGINGDVATCAIVINSIPQLLRAGSGLKTMLDIPPVSFCNLKKSKKK